MRKQLALFQEREKRAAATTAADRFVLSKLARLFDWRSALVIVKPATLIGWHRAAFRRFGRWKLRPVGRPAISAQVRRLIRRMAAENLTWGEERIADELWLKLQIRLSPRTIGKYIEQAPRPRASNDQRWSTFILDYLIPLNASHLRRTLREWACHYNAGRPHRSLGPGIPDQVQQAPRLSQNKRLDFPQFLV